MSSTDSMSSATTPQVDRRPSVAPAPAPAGHVRALTEADLPAVSRLFQKTFRDPDTAASASLTAYLRGPFLDHPCQDREICSRVFVGGDGELSGFIGVLPQSMLYRDQPLRAAVAGSLMVEHPERNPTAGARLLRSVLQGPQDLSISESANPLSQRMWERIGGIAVAPYSMEWVRVLRPATLPVAMLAERFSAARLFGPLTLGIDRLLGRVRSNPLNLARGSASNAVDIAVDDEEFIAAVPKFLAGYVLRPNWDAAQLRWLLQHAAEKERYGSLQRRLVLDANKKPLGGYLYYGRPGRIAFVLQVFAQGAARDAVMENLFARAFERGCVALRGRAQPELADALLRHRCVFLHRSSMVVHSKQPELIEAIRLGDALITGLAAESWMKLIGGEFV